MHDHQTLIFQMNIVHGVAHLRNSAKKILNTIEIWRDVFFTFVIYQEHRFLPSRFHK